jgi:hypothetical protein
MLRSRTLARKIVLNLFFVQACPIAKNIFTNCATFLFTTFLNLLHNSKLLHTSACLDEELTFNVSLHVTVSELFLLADSGPRAAGLYYNFAPLASSGLWPACRRAVHLQCTKDGPNNYKDTKPKISSLLVFNRVYRLEIVSHVGIFDPSCELAPL